MSIEQIMAEYEFFQYLKELEGPSLPPPASKADHWVEVSIDPIHQTVLEAIKAAVDIEWFQKGYRIVEVNRQSGFGSVPRVWLHRG